MKPRDLIFAILLAGLLAYPLLVPIAAAHAPGGGHKTIMDRTLDALAIWWLVRDVAPPAPIQELPDHLVNRQTERETGPDGEPLIDHSAGW